MSWQNEYIKIKNRLAMLEVLNQPIKFTFGQIEELAVKKGIRSKATICGHLEELQDEGLVSHDKKQYGITKQGIEEVERLRATIKSREKIFGIFSEKIATEEIKTTSVVVGTETKKWITAGTVTGFSARTQNIDKTLVKSKIEQFVNELVDHLPNDCERVELSLGIMVKRK